ELLGGQTCAKKRPCRRLGNAPGAEDNRPRAFEAGLAEIAAQEAHRSCCEGSRMARKLGLGANALTRPERMAEEWRQLGTGRPRGSRDAETASYLAKYLGLSDDHRIQACGDAKKVRRG